MKKVILLGGALACLASIPAANAQIIIQPTIVESAPAYVVAPYAPPGVIITYPVHFDHHHHYDWRYWNERREHEEHERR
jgi:hypothetical protein